MPGPTAKTRCIHQTGIDSPLKEALNCNTSEVGSPERVHLVLLGVFKDNESLSGVPMDIDA